MNIHAAYSERPAVPGRTILGIRVASLAWKDAEALLLRFVRERRYTKIGFLNAHNANVAARDREFADAMRDFLVLPDGVGVDIASKLLFGKSFPSNLNGTDFIPGFIASTREPITVGLIGAKRSNAEGALRKLADMAPQHRFEFIHDGYFTPEEEPGILAHIERVRPDILLVAMGVPRQELWIASKLTQAHCTLPMAVGALLDFLSGAVPRAPLWVRRWRLEWLFRLAVEPGRLWRRYVVGNPAFLMRVLRQKLTGHGGSLNDEVKA
ncbi:MAG: WecB/TagA/CpsF family glycosyltransferase [Rhizobiaceae bacterium]